MLTRINSLERKYKWIDGAEKHNMRTSQITHEFQYPNRPSRERISEIEDQLNETKWEGKIRVKRNEQSLQEIWDYVKRSNLRLIGVPESDGENEAKLENTLQDIIQEKFPNPASRPTFTSRKYREHHKDIPQEEQYQGT